MCFKKEGSSSGEKPQVKSYFGIFFGWWTVLASNLMSILVNSLTVYGFGVFLKPLANEFGWSRAATAGAGSLGRLEGGLEGPFGGIVTDKYGPRIVCFIGGIIAGLGFILMSQVNSLTTFYLYWLIASTGINLGLGGPLFKAITDWFVKKRGLAMSLSKAGFAIGGAIMPTILTVLMTMYGWRHTFVIAGLISWIVILPLSWFFLRPHRPEYYGLLPDGAKVGKEAYNKLRAGEENTNNVDELEFSARQAFVTRAFWLTGIAFAIRSLVTGVVNVHTIPFLTDMGMDPLAAAAAMGLLVGISLPGRLLGGILSDRFKAEKIRFLFIFGLSGIIVSFVILLNAGTNMLFLYAYIIIYGFIGLGFCSTVIPIMKAQYFGRKSYSTIDGTQTFMNTIAGIISPIYAGWVYDMTKSYISAFTTVLAFVFLAIIIIFFAKPPKMIEK
jgi:sugar phosphate permease